jgi:hypothetical protein
MPGRSSEIVAPANADPVTGTIDTGLWRRIRRLRVEADELAREYERADTLCVEIDETKLNRAAAAAGVTPSDVLSLLRAPSLRARVEIFGRLVETTVELITLERRAYGLDDDTESDHGLVDDAALKTEAVEEVDRGKAF